MNLSILRRYFLICGNQIVKSVSRKFPKCLLYLGQCVSQQMSSLPIERLVFTYPFVATGVDYAGTINVTSSKGRGIMSTKGYICIFICLVKRANLVFFRIFEADVLSEKNKSEKTCF